MSSVLLYLAIVVMWLGVLIPMWLRRDRSDLVDLDDLPADETGTITADLSAEDRTPVPAGDPRPDAVRADVDRSALSARAEEETPSSSGSPHREEPSARAGQARPGHDDGPPSSPRTVPAEVAVGDEETPLPPGRGIPARRPPGDPRRRAALRRRAVIVARRRRRLLWCVLLLLASVVTATVEVIPWWGVAPSAVLLLGYLVLLRVAARVDRERRRRAAEARRRALQRAAKRRDAEVVTFARPQPDEIFDQYAPSPRRAVGD